MTFIDPARVTVSGPYHVTGITDAAEASYIAAFTRVFGRAPTADDLKRSIVQSLETATWKPS